MIAPDAGDFIDQGFGGMRVLDDIDKREIGDHVGHRQGEIGVGHEAKAHQRDRRRDGHQPLVARDAAPYRQHGIDERERQGEHKRVMAGFDDHPRPFGEQSTLTLNCVSSFARCASDSRRSRSSLVSINGCWVARSAAKISDRRL